MAKGLKSQFVKSGSRYQFNIDRIMEKYCNASNKRELALEALQRDFGNAHISSPVVDLNDESDADICEVLNENFEMEYSKRSRLSAGNGNAGQSVPSSCRKPRNHRKKLQDEQLDAVGKYISSMSRHRHIANMMTNSVKEEPYQTGHKRRRVDECIHDGIIDVIISSIREGPIHMNNQLPMHASDRGRFTTSKNETFLHAWFRNMERYIANNNFVQDRSFRSRAAYNARRSAHRDLGYVNISR